MDCLFCKIVSGEIKSNKVYEDELTYAAALADGTGLLSCPQTGVALAAMMKLVDRKEIESNA